jgi:indole-3-acetate monooxygenase
MTITEPTTARTAADVFDQVHALAPTITARAPEIEADRRLPNDLVKAATQAGCFRLVRPESHGGIAADWPSAMRVFEELARADASTAWSIAIGSAGWCDLASLPRETFDAIFREKPDAITAGVFSPSGSISATAGGYHVDGRWSFASGCEHADWIYGNCVESVVDGVPQLRGAVFRPNEVVIEDTWSVSGLCGTGSHHFHVEGVKVPAERTYVPLTGEPCVDATILRLPLPSLFATGIAAIATGIARGALDDLGDLATGKVPLLSPGTLAMSPLFQYQLATADADLRGARALLWETAESTWAKAEADTEFALEDIARMRATAAWATARAADAVDTAYLAGGGSSIYTKNPLQRRWRDVHAVSQHFLVKPETFTNAGAILAGQDAHVMVF